MQSTALQFSLPTFDELRMTAARPRYGKVISSHRSMNVIAAVPALNLLKVAAYCRVSTDHDDQQESIAIQQEHWKTLAAQHPDWDFVGVYVDIVSGTKKEKRPELQRLLTDCDEGRVSLVLTKSVSRFARNTTDLLEMVRSMTATGTNLFFERENIDTRTMDSEFLLTILASLAEDESHSISTNCRWGLQRRFEDGTYRAASAPYGYDLVDGNYAVNETEAAIVQEIYKRFLTGSTMAGIAEELNSRGIPTKRAGQVWKGKEIATVWTGERISKILSNLSYTGDQVLQKCFTDHNFQMRRNRGQYPQYHLEEHHPGIIDRDTFAAVQERLEKNKPATPPAPKQYTTLSGMLTCGCCGAKLIRNVNRVGNVYWVCSRRRKKASSCSMPSISEEAFRADFITLLARLKVDDSPVVDYLDSLNQSFHTQSTVAILESRIAEIDREMDAMKHTRCRVTTSDFFSRLNALSAERESLQNELDAMKDNRIEMTEELLKLIHSSGGSFDFIVPMITEGVTAHARGVYTVRFRCGLEIDFNAAEEPVITQPMATEPTAENEFEEETECR